MEAPLNIYIGYFLMDIIIGICDLRKVISDLAPTWVMQITIFILLWRVQIVLSENSWEIKISKSVE